MWSSVTWPPLHLGDGGNVDCNYILCSRQCDLSLSPSRQNTPMARNITVPLQSSLEYKNLWSDEGPEARSYPKMNREISKIGRVMRELKPRCWLSESLLQTRPAPSSYGVKITVRLWQYAKNRLAFSGVRSCKSWRVSRKRRSRQGNITVPPARLRSLQGRERSPAKNYLSAPNGM